MNIRLVAIRAFTLIEILIVIVLIGITVGFALLAYGDFGGRKRILFAAEQLGNYIKLAQQQAILESATLGLQTDKNSYRIVKLQPDSQWLPIANKGIFKTQYLPDNAMMTFHAQGKTLFTTPSLLIYSSGDLTPLSITFGTEKEKVITELTTRANGDIVFSSETRK